MKQLSLDLGIDLNESIIDRQILSLPDKIQRAQKALRLAADMSKTYYGEPLIIAYSGGKDSDVLLHLAEGCLNPDEFEMINGHTTVDAPETVYHIRETFKRLNVKGVKTTIDYHKKLDGTNETMWNLIVQNHYPPTRLARYCCRVLKETTTPNRLCALGVREAESVGRRGKDIFTTRGKTQKDALYFSLSHAEEVHREAQEINDDSWDCTLIKTMKEHKATIVNPIYEWSDTDIWEYAGREKINLNPLYSKGYERVGCIGCPLANYRQRVKQFNDYPKYKQMYINAFQKMIEEKPFRKTKSGEEVFYWWLEEGKHNVIGQMSLFDDMQETEDT